jgi:hypothetical protein
MANTMLFVVGLGFLSLWIWLLTLVIRALRKYIRSGDVRREKEVLKKCRIERNMTQEFVAEALGVSRQAVSKWETVAADPAPPSVPWPSTFGTRRRNAAGDWVKEQDFPRFPLTKRKKPHKMDALTTLMGRKADRPALREPAAGASRRGRCAHTGPGVFRLNRTGRAGRQAPLSAGPRRGTLRAAG